MFTVSFQQYSAFVSCLLQMVQLGFLAVLYRWYSWDW